MTTVRAGRATRDDSWWRRPPPPPAGGRLDRLSPRDTLWTVSLDSFVSGLIRARWRTSTDHHSSRPRAPYGRDACKTRRGGAARERRPLLRPCVRVPTTLAIVMTVSLTDLPPPTLEIARTVACPGFGASYFGRRYTLARHVAE